MRTAPGQPKSKSIPVQVTLAPRHFQLVSSWAEEDGSSIPDKLRELIALKNKLLLIAQRDPNETIMVRELLNDADLARLT